MAYPEPPKLPPYRPCETPSLMTGGRLDADLDAIEDYLPTLGGYIDSQDEALGSRVDALTDRVDEAESVIEELEDRVYGAEEDVAALETRMDGAESDIDALKGRVGTVESDIGELEDRVYGVEEDVAALETRMDGAESEIRANDSIIESHGERLDALEALGPGTGGRTMRIVENPTGGTVQIGANTIEPLYVSVPPSDGHSIVAAFPISWSLRAGGSTLAPAGGGATVSGVIAQQGSGDEGYIAGLFVANPSGEAVAVQVQVHAMLVIEEEA